MLTIAVNYVILLRKKANTMKTMLRFMAVALLTSISFLTVQAQQGPSTYDDGDSLAALVKMKYVYSFEEALAKARQTKKPIFFNCFADWARPCHGMNGMVFSDQAFCDWMDKNFVCFFADVTKTDNRYLAQRYDISTFAHYLILDADGQVVHRIVGGATLPDFQDRVALGLSPKTSLAGTRAAYEKGDRSKKLLLNYLKALNLAGEDSLFNLIAPTYTKQLQPKDYAQKENWLFACKNIHDSSDPIFQYITANRAPFDKNIGTEKVNDLIASIYGKDIYAYATGDKAFDENALLNTYMAMQKAGLPQTNNAYALYNIVKLYGKHQFAQTIEALNQLNDEQTHYMMDVTLKYPDATPAEQQQLISYYAEREKKYAAVGSSLARAYRELADNLRSPVDETAGEGGIAFTSGTFDELLAKAKAENKLVFIDGYTSWCGPCKMLAKQTFPQKEVGEYMNPRFVSAQIDMERGEGPELAKRFNISAYPTMLILRSDGSLVEKIVGFFAPLPFLDKVKSIIEN